MWSSRLVRGAIETARGDGAGGDAQGGQETSGAEALVGGGEAARPAGAQRQLGLGAIQGLDLGFLVDREHQRAARRVEVEADDRGLLGGELGIGAAAAPVVGLVRLQIARVQHPVDARRADPRDPGELPLGPARAAARRRLGGALDDRPAGRRRDRRRPARARPVAQSLEPPGGEPPPPFRARLWTQAAHRARPGDAPAFGRGEHHLGALRQTPLDLLARRPQPELTRLVLTQHDPHPTPPHAPSPAKPTGSLSYHIYYATQH